MTQRVLPRPGSRRALAALGGGFLLALVLGMIAGRWPLVAVGAVAAVALAAVMFRDLATGIVIFTVASFAGILATNHGASMAKVVGGLLVFAWVAALARRPGREMRSLFSAHRGFAVCAIALLAWSVLSAAWAQSSSTALAGASRWAMDLVLLPILFAGLRHPAHVRRTMWAFVGGALVAILYGVATGTMGTYSRVASAVDDPEGTAMVLVAAATLAFALGASEQTRMRRTVGFGAGLAALLGVAATGSRGGLVALGAAIVAAVFMAGRWRPKVAPVAAVGAIVVLGWFLLLAPATARDHVSNLQTGRTTLWMVAGRSIAANPVVGVGLDNFAVTSGQYIVRPGFTDNARQILIEPKPAHNIFLEVWADLGIIGLVLFAALLLTSLRCAAAAVKVFERNGRRREELLARGLVVAIVAMVAADFFMSSIYSKQLFILLALGPTMLGVARSLARSEPA